ncbi:MAG: geranylgeranyl reductase family protein [Bacteroidia bacterium]|nr:geranylgeranyl reductase family protein [Bacteroidia bacterium]
METNKFDIIIVGAGPAGCSCAINLAHSGLNIAILDKALFPKDKICGGALSDRAVNTILRMPDPIPSDFIKFQKKIVAQGIRLFAPDNSYYDLILPSRKGNENIANGYICRRTDFDNFMFEQLLRYKNIIFIHCNVTDVEIHSDKVTVISETNSFESKLLVAADGANSLISRKLCGFTINKNIFSTAVRAYYKNVTGFDSKNLAELHFIKNILPGYLWIFPLGDDLYNVGIGGPAKLLEKKKIKLSEFMLRLISEHPTLSLRFKNASSEGKIHTHSLPLGTKKQKLSGERFILAGDAASLVDPFSGEGIGNALLSGEMAAKFIERCFAENNFSETYIKSYDETIYKRLWAEFKIHYRMSKFFRYEFLFNFLIRKANKNKRFHEMISDMLQNNMKRKQLLNPLLYLQLFFN